MVQHQTLYLPAQDRRRMSGLCYAKTGPLVSIPNSNQAESTQQPVSADLLHAENNSLIEPSTLLLGLARDLMNPVA
jgi:hypothetical protein